jgi:hypothetical protein
MYSLVLMLHSWLRWLVVLAAVAVVVRAAIGLRARKLWGPADDRGMLFLTIAFDIQVLLGLVLYVGLSPVIGLAFQNLGAAMRNGAIRFFLIEHMFGMLVAVALVHVGRVKVRKSVDAAAKHRLALTFVVISLIVLVLSIPWPGTPPDRPLFRFSVTE